MVFQTYSIFRPRTRVILRLQVASGEKTNSCKIGRVRFDSTVPGTGPGPIRGTRTPGRPALA